MYSAKRLENEEPCIFDEVVKTSDEEEVVDDHRLTFAKFRLRRVEVEGDVQTFNELSDWIFVCVGLLLDDFDEVFDDSLSAFIRYDRRRQIP